MFLERDRELSTVHHLRLGMPPTIVFHGTSDRTVPFENAERFVSSMKALGNKCELVAFEGADHGFFNSPAFRKGSSPDQSDVSLYYTQSGADPGSAPSLIVLMSLQPAIPWWGALLHCPPQLHRLDSNCHSPAETANHHLPGLGNFRPVIWAFSTAIDPKG